MPGWRCLIVSATLLFGGGALLAGSAAHAQDFGGQIEYTGDAGPIGNRRPLCLCVYSDAQLLSELGCAIFHSNPVRYRIDSLGAGDYYLIAFVDLHINERLDADEPFEIYRDRALPPGDPVGGQSGAMNIDFIFGDENLPAPETPTPTASPSSTPSPLPTSTPPVPGDCDGDGAVTISELVRGVAIALGQQDVAECPPADGDHNRMVSVAELILAVNAALGRIAP